MIYPYRVLVVVFLENLMMIELSINYKISIQELKRALDCLIENRRDSSEREVLYE